MDREAILKMKQIASVLVSIAVWIVSMKFSVDGFGLEMQGIAWVGIILACAITVIELVFSSQANSKNPNLTIFIIGILCYVYGVFSNFAGIWMAQSHTTLNDVLDSPLSALFVFFVALFVEVVPEMLFMYGLLGNNMQGEGDVLGVLLRSGRPPVSGGGDRHNSGTAVIGGNNNHGHGQPVPPMDSRRRF